MALNLFNVQLQESDEDDGGEKCMICHEGLSTAPTYALPECKHTYHTHCIVTWFRHRPPEGTLGSSSDGKCPYCGNRGINNTEDPNPDIYRRYLRLTPFQKYNMQFLKKYSNSPGAPKHLTNLIKKEKIQEQSLRDCKKEQTELKKSTKTKLVNFSETKKKMTSLRQSQWKKHFSLRKTQRAIAQFPVIPIIIPIPVDIN
jgi:hypothetical protein